MALLMHGKYVSQLAKSVEEVSHAQNLRHLAFGLSDRSGLDSDIFDQTCKHFLVKDQRNGNLVCCFRLMPFKGGYEIEKSYSAQYYELSALHAYGGKLAEIGRFCVHPDLKDPDALRVAWGTVAKYVDEHGVDLLFGCTSFKGTDASEYYDTFAMLRDKHLAPKRLLPNIKAPKVFRFAARLRRKPDFRIAMLRMPPLLKTYLMMGGWVSDHAVVDDHMNTLHVFTGVEIGLIPPERSRRLRMLY